MRTLVLVALMMPLSGCGAVPAWVAVGAAGVGYVASANNVVAGWLNFRAAEVSHEAPRP